MGIKNLIIVSSMELSQTRRNVGYPVSILLKSISGRHRPVRVADGPMMARCRFM